MIPVVPFRALRLLLPILAVLLLTACERGVDAPVAPAPPPAEPGVLRIATQPGEARLYVDDRLQGNTPAGEGEFFALRLPEGAYRIEAIRPLDAFTELYGRIDGIEVANRPLDPVVLRLRPRLTSEGEEREARERERLAERERALVARFDLDGATATDTATGLMWTRCSLGQEWDGASCAGEPRIFTWGQAREAAEAARVAGYDDWRLPTIDELHALTYCSSGRRYALDRDGSGGGCADDHASPTILQDVFPDTPAVRYWSGTPHELYTYRAWGVAFTNGIRGAGGRGDYDRVRLVRDLP